MLAPAADAMQVNKGGPQRQGGDLGSASKKDIRKMLMGEEGVVNTARSLDLLRRAVEERDEVLS